jgi:hypothetical protein
MSTTFYVGGLVKEQVAELRRRFPSAEFERLPPGWNVTLHHEEQADQFFEWCEDNGLEAEMV